MEFLFRLCHLLCGASSTMSTFRLSKELPVTAIFMLLLKDCSAQSGFYLYRLFTI
jgi:hypothetical protein